MITLKNMDRQDMINMRDELNDLIGDEKVITSDFEIGDEKVITSDFEIEPEKPITLDMSTNDKEEMFKKLALELDQTLEVDEVAKLMIRSNLKDKSNFIINGAYDMSKEEVKHRFEEYTKIYMEYIKESRPALKIIFNS